MADPEVWQLIRDDIAQLRTDFTARLDRLVSTEAHAADMRRVDDRLAELAADIAAERSERAAGHATILGSVDRLTEALATEAKSRAEGDKAVDAARISGNRWAFGAIIAVATALVGVLTVVIMVLQGQS